MQDTSCAPAQSLNVQFHTTPECSQKLIPPAGDTLGAVATSPIGATPPVESHAASMPSTAIKCGSGVRRHSRGTNPGHHLPAAVAVAAVVAPLPHLVVLGSTCRPTWPDSPALWTTPAPRRRCGPRVPAMDAPQ